MKRIRSRMSILCSVCLFVATAFLSISCEQPPMVCEVASDAYVMKYFPKDPDNDCLGLAGELVGMDVYNPPKGDEQQIDASRATIAIQSNTMGSLADDAQWNAGVIDANSAHKQYALGDYAVRPDENDFCAATNLAPAQQEYPLTSYTDADGNPALFPETSFLQQWKDVKVHVTFSTPGNAAMGEVTMTRVTKTPFMPEPETCTVTYVASGLFPAVGCEALDENGEGTGLPDDLRCCSNANIEKGRLYGSGIHPDYKTKCDPVLLACVLDWGPGQAFPPLGSNPACD